jgi:epidermal growth factor receptor substrate 15
MAPWVVVSHTLVYVGPGLPQRGPGAPGLPAGGVRPPLPPHLHSQTDATSRPGLQRSHMPGMDNHVAPQGNKDDRSGVNPVAQEVADAPKKVRGPHPYIIYPE